MQFMQNNKEIIINLISNKNTFHVISQNLFLTP